MNKVFSDFVEILNSQSTYNQGGKINAVPFIIFHNVALTTNRPYYTNAELFDQSMKYLYENHFKVLTYKQLGYNPQTNTFYLKFSNAKVYPKVLSSHMNESYSSLMLT
jgi:hypothetical protein